MFKRLHETTALFPTPQQVTRAVEAGRISGVTVEILPSSTAIDREVAASSYSLSAELIGDPTINPDLWRLRALQAMDLGGAVVQIIAAESTDPSKMFDSNFWQAYSRTIPV